MPSAHHWSWRGRQPSPGGAALWRGTARDPTGSKRAGIEIAINAAPTVKRVAQELGGMSPYLAPVGLSDPENPHTQPRIDRPPQPRGHFSLPVTKARAFARPNVRAATRIEPI